MISSTPKKEKKFTLNKDRVVVGKQNTARRIRQRQIAFSVLTVELRVDLHKDHRRALLIDALKGLHLGTLRQKTRVFSLGKEFRLSVFFRVLAFENNKD